MIRRVRDWLTTLGDLLLSAGPLIALVALALWGAYRLIDPTPPSRLVMATGPEGSDYEALGLRYQAALKRYGITVELRGTAGSRENLDALLTTDSGVDVAFVRGGTLPRDPVALAEAEDELVSLGVLFPEPVWVFHRASLTLRGLTGLRDRRVGVGAAGSGAVVLVESLLAQNGMTLADLRADNAPATQAVAALLDGDLDAVFLTSASDSPIVQMLLRTPGIRLYDFLQAEAYTRRLPDLKHVVLPRGVVDLARDQPPRDLNLLAPMSTLVARNDLHRALVALLVESAQQIHGQPDWFAHAKEYPAPVATGFPLSDEALRVYKGGPSFLQRYLPYWLANLIDRMWLVLLSVVALLIPLTRIVPPIYTWRVRSRIYRWYGALRAIERDAGATEGGQIPAGALTPEAAAPLMRRLGEIEEAVNALSVPLSYADELYFLRQHIDLVRARLTAAQASPSSEHRSPQDP